MEEHSVCSLHVNFWKGNGSFWSMPSCLLDTVGLADVLVTETCEISMQPLSRVMGLHWLSTHREEIQSSSGVRGLGGVACLVSDQF